MLVTHINNDKGLGFVDVYGVPHGFSPWLTVPTYDHWAAQFATEKQAICLNQASRLQHPPTLQSKASLLCVCQAPNLRGHLHFSPKQVSTE